MARTKQTARKSTGGKFQATGGFTLELVATLRDSVASLDNTLAPGAQSPGASPFVLPLVLWLRWDRDEQTWESCVEDHDDWKPFAATILRLFENFEHPAVHLALGGVAGVRLVVSLLEAFAGQDVVPKESENEFRLICEGIGAAVQAQINANIREEGTFQTLLPTEILELIIKAASEKDDTLLKLALVHPTWRDIALPVLSKSVKLEGDHALVTSWKKFADRNAGSPFYPTHEFSYSRGSDSTVEMDLISNFVVAFSYLRVLTLSHAQVSFALFNSTSLSHLTELSLENISLEAIPDCGPFDVKLKLHSLRLKNISGPLYSEGWPELFAGIMASSSGTLTRLSLDSPDALTTYATPISSKLVELGLDYNSSDVAFITGLNLSALRKLSITPAQLVEILAFSTPLAPIDSLTIVCGWHGFVGEDDISRINKFLLTTTCATFNLEDVHFSKVKNQFPCA